MKKDFYSPKFCIFRTKKINNRKVFSFFLNHNWLVEDEMFHPTPIFKVLASALKTESLTIKELSSSGMFLRFAYNSIPAEIELDWNFLKEKFEKETFSLKKFLNEIKDIIKTKIEENQHQTEEKFEFKSIS